jgi:hypothetical protein
MALDRTGLEVEPPDRIVDEALLRRGIDGPDVKRGRCEALIEAAGLPDRPKPRRRG